MSNEKTVVQPSDGTDYCFCIMTGINNFLFFMKSNFIDEKSFPQAWKVQEIGG